MDRYLKTLNPAVMFSAFLFGSCAFAVELTPRECKYIEVYNRVIETKTLTDDAVHMAHNLELCSGGNTNCEQPLKKRTRDYYLSLHPLNDPEYKGLMAVTAGMMRTFLEKATPLDTLAGFERLGGDQITVFLVNDENAQTLIDKNQISDVALFKKFLKAKKTNCLSVAYDWEALGQEYSEVWIKSGQPKESLVHCFREEVYNASGIPGDPIGDASLYSDKRVQEEDAGYPIYQQLSTRDYIIMRLIYSEENRNGQSKAETKEIIDAIIERECK